MLHGEWCYIREKKWKTVPELIQMLIRHTSRGGNLLLNVGPTSRGLLDKHTVELLEGLGEWMKWNSKAIYNCTGAPAEFPEPEGCRYTYNCSEKTWIMRIAMHACYDINRSGWFRFMNRRVTPEMLPEQAAAFDEQDEELTLAVMQLPRKEREVILLYYYQGMKVNEIAQALRIAHSSVSGRLKRGRNRMKMLLEGRDGDE